MRNLNVNYIPVLQYTSVIESDNGDTHFCTTIDKFAKDMHQLLENGFVSVSLRDVYLFSRGEIQLPDKVFCLIFKGGYENNYTQAFAILKQLSIKASIFVATDLIGVFEYPGVENYSPHFDWKQAQEMIDSGLVGIYPLWHPFDNGRNLKIEVQNKITLLNDNLVGNDASFAFAYNECDYYSLSILNESGVTVNITDCFHISLSNLDQGAVPSIYVDHTSNVLEVIEQYNVLLEDVIEKDQINLEKTAVYSEPNLDLLQTSIQLPIELHPMARNYLRHAFPLSVLQAEKKDKVERIILSDYIEVIYKPWYNWFDYHNYLYEYWDCIDYRRLSKEILDANNINIIDYIINGLRIGYYSDIWLDTFYIPGKPGYAKRHMTHGILIYGYNSDTTSFCALSYTDNGQYQEMRIPIKSVALACTNRYFMYINLIRSRKGSVVEYDVHKIRDGLYNYINSICYDDNTRYSKKSSQQYYGYEACVRFMENTKKQAEADKYIHTTAMYGYTEHKRLMMWRLRYIAEHENLSIPGIIEITELYIRKTEQLMNLCLKFNFTKSQSSFSSIVSSIGEMNSAEKTLIEAVIEAIDNKYASSKLSQ